MITEPPAKPVNEATIVQYLTQTFANVHVIATEDTYFFFYGPMADDNKFPFATLVTNDAHDQASDLEREGVFRLNMGVSKATFLSLFGTRVPRPTEEGIIEAGYDYTALDTLMPHPVYGNMYWVCVLNPAPATYPQVQRLLTEAYEMTVAQARRRERTG